MTRIRLWLIVGFAAGALAIAWVAVRPWRGTRHVAAELLEPRNVRVGSPVAYRGVEVGRVVRLAPRGEVAEVMLQIDQPELPLRRDDRVRRIQLGAAGAGVDAVEIVPSSESSPPLGRTEVLRGAPPAPPPGAERRLTPADSLQIRGNPAT